LRKIWREKTSQSMAHSKFSIHKKEDKWSENMLTTTKLGSRGRRWSTAGLGTAAVGSVKERPSQAQAAVGGGDGQDGRGRRATEGGGGLDRDLVST
jgi:hypothetical protein